MITALEGRIVREGTALNLRVDCPLLALFVPGRVSLPVKRCLLIQVRLPPSLFLLLLSDPLHLFSADLLL